VSGPVSNVTPDLMRMICAATKRGKFTLASGRESDFYIDARQVTLTPRGLAWTAEFLRTFLASMRPGPTAVGGPATASIPIFSAAVPHLNESWVDVPDSVLGVRKLFYVRKEAKGHGTRRLIEGPPLDARDLVVLVDDVLTTGESLIHAAEVVREEGANVLAAFVLVDREEGGREALEEAGFHAFYPVTTKSAIFSFMDRLSMMGG